MKVGSDREADVYYDRESLRIVQYIVKTDQNRNSWLTPFTPKALVIKVLYNYFVPTKCPQEICLEQPVSSMTLEDAITCNDLNVFYEVSTTFTSGKFNFGQVVSHWEIGMHKWNFHYVEEKELTRRSSQTGPLTRKILRELGHLCR